MPNKKTIRFFAIIIIIILTVFFVRFVIGGSEDDWVCANGEWIKHGSPNAPMPTEPCN